MGSPARGRGSLVHWFVATLIALGLTASGLEPQPVTAAGLAPLSVLGWAPGITRDVPPGGSFTVYFNRPVDPASMQRAWRMTPAVPGAFSLGSASVTFTPAHSLRPGSSYRLTIDQSARDLAGLALAHAFSVAFSTGDALRVQSYTPWTGTTAVPINGLIAVTFNHPMVALAGLSALAGNPVGWSVAISPRVAGYGSWLGTSSWVFHPSSGLEPSTRYRVIVSRSVRDAWGQPLGHDLSWSFRTITPEIYSRSPAAGAQFADPRGPITVTFNQPMDRRSTARAFSLRIAGTQVPGSISWKGTTLLFRPNSPLDSAGSYLVTVAGSALAANHRAALNRSVHWRFHAAPPPRVDSTDPDEGHTAYEGGVGQYVGPAGAVSGYAASFSFDTPMNKRSLDRHLTISPALPRLDTWLYGPNEASEFVYGISGDFKPSTRYVITIGAGARDRFGRLLTAPYALHFKTARLRPSVALYGMPNEQGIAFSAGRIVTAPIQFVDVPRADYTLIHTTLKALSQRCCDQTTPPAGQTIREWSEAIPDPLNQVQNLGVKLTRKDGSPLAPGLYWLSATTPSDLPGLPPAAILPFSSEIVVVTNVSTTVKRGGNGTLVWISSAQSGQPLANVRVRLVDFDGSTIASGTTDGHGTHFFSSSINRGRGNVVVDDGTHFGTALEYWSPDTSSPENLPFLAQYGPSSNGTYLYTDRPVYRPGQRVRLRGLLWRNRDGVYALLGPRVAQVQAVDATGRPIYHAQLRLDRFGAIHGSFLLPRTTPTGPDTVYVNITNLANASTSFSVAEYRKPEFLTAVTMAHPSFVQGQTLTAAVDVTYVFGAPVTQQRVSWVAYAQPNFPQPPGWADYSFFDQETYWQETLIPTPNVQQSQFGKEIGHGSGTTDGQGALAVRLPVDLSKEPIDQTVTVEATTTDINHQSVSQRAQASAYKSGLAIGLHAEHQVVPAGQPVTVDVAAVRHDGTPLPNSALVASIVKRTYTSKLVDNGAGQSSWQPVPHDTPVGTQNLTADAHGLAHVVFTPTDGGEYRVSVEGKDELGNDATNVLSVYVSAAGFSDWGLTSNTTLSLKPDKATYQVGDTAHVLVAAPFDNATALVTLERGNIRKYWVQHLQTNSATVDVPITLGDLPNVYLTVTLYRGWRGDSPPDWRYGMEELHVRVDPKHLIVHLTGNGYRHHPGDPVTYTVTTTDMHGRPVSAQLSLALVDTAVLALQDENNPDILKALYGDRPLGVATGSDGVLSVDHLQLRPDFQLQGAGSNTNVPIPKPAPKAGGAPSFGPVQGSAAARAPATGGGGCGATCGAPLTVRSRFVDTAYWSGSLVTDASGHAIVRLTLPDNATTWRLDARAVTADQQVGGAQMRTLASQDVVLRPVVPRFLLEGDSLRVGTVVNDTLSRPVRVAVSIAASGLAVRSGPPVTLQVPAHGERLLLWPAAVPEGSSARLTLSATSLTPGVRGDAVRLTLPVHPPLTDETVAASGQVFGSVRQLVVVPRDAVPRPGALTVQLSASLTAGLGAAYREFRPRQYESNDDVANRVLAAGSLHTLPQPITGLTPSAYRQLPLVIAAGVQKLLDNQYSDGGWPWFNAPFAPSDPLITADAVQALAASGERSALVAGAMARGRNYLRGQLGSVPPAERAHLLLVLAQSGSRPRSAARALYRDSIRRSHLDNGPLADLGLALDLTEKGGSGGVRATGAQSIVSTLDSRAVVSATGAHWESNAWSYWSGPPIAATTEVLRMLVALSPHDPFVPAAVRWLMLARRGDAWDCQRDSAQAIAALAAFARAAREGTADYAYQVMVDGTMRTSGRYNPSSQRSVNTVRVPVAQLHRESTNALVISRQAEGGSFGPGPLYYVARLQYYLRADAIAPRSEGVSVGRRYLDLQGKPVTAVRAGSPVQIELTIHTDQTLLYLDVEDPLPAGFEPIDESLNTSRQGLFKPQPFLPFGPIQDLSWYLIHTDLHDDRASLYAYYLPPGTYRYTYLAQATVAGRYEVAPTHASETFFPEVFGRSAGQMVTVG